MSDRVPDPPTDPPSYYHADPVCPRCNRMVDDDGSHTDECAYRGLDMEALDTALKQSKIDIDDGDVVAHRKALMVQCERLEPGTQVELTYDSSRGSGERTITATARMSPDDRAIFAGRTDDLTGDDVDALLNAPRKGEYGEIDPEALAEKIEIPTFDGPAPEYAVEEGPVRGTVTSLVDPDDPDLESGPPITLWCDDCGSYEALLALDEYPSSVDDVDEYEAECAVCGGTIVAEIDEDA